MKPFDLEKCKKAYPVCCADGNKVTILADDLDGAFAISGIIHIGEKKFAALWTAQGYYHYIDNFHDFSVYDLVMED